MQDLKTRQQGNSVTVTIPKEFGIKAGTIVRPKRTLKGFEYELVDSKDCFFDFTSDILQDVISEGYEGEDILNEFNKRKDKVEYSLTKLGSEKEETTTYTKEQARAKFGL